MTDDAFDFLTLQSILELKVCYTPREMPGPINKEFVFIRGTFT